MKKLLLLLSALWFITGCSTQQQSTADTTIQSVGESQLQSETVTVNILVDGKAIEGSPFKWEVTKDMTLLEAMEHNLDIEENNGFISSINGYRQDEKSNKWWLFDYNGKMSEVGAAEVKLKSGDIVDWKLEAFES